MTDLDRAVATQLANIRKRTGRSIDELAAHAGPKAALRPIHDRPQEALLGWGDFEGVPKKTYVSYRGMKQFAMIGPAMKTRVEVGLNMKGVAATDRLEALPAGQMRAYRVRLADAEEVDAELLGWIRMAYDAAGG